MQQLTIDPPMPYLVPPDRPLALILVGCGGTGSHIAQSIARLCHHSADTERPIAVSFVDGDTVEDRNVGRQLFSAADIGRNKAQTLAARFGSVFGVPITAYPEMATRDRMQQLCAAHERAFRIVVGAVDTAEGRQVMADTLAARWCHLWLDAGNANDNGQVVAGTVTTAKDLRGCLALGGVCAALPAPSLVYPGLLVPEPTPAADCAAAMADDTQSLMINQAMAAVVAQYLYQLVVQRRLTRFATMIDLATLTMRSLPITAAQLSATVQMPVAQLTATSKPSKRKERSR
jgi:PRTRC genetic system ThiF family protein